MGLFRALTLYFRNYQVIRRIKHLTRALKRKGLEVRVRHGSRNFPLAESLLGNTGISLYRAKLMEKIPEVYFFLQGTRDFVEECPIEERPSGYLHLNEALQQFTTAVSKLGPNEILKLEKSLLKEAVTCNLDTTAERALSERMRKVMQIVIGQHQAMSLKDLCHLIVERVRLDFNATNPSLMLYETDEKGQGNLVPIALAMPKTVIAMGEKLRGKRLGEHRIPITKVDNFFVDKFLEADTRKAGILDCGEVSFETYVKIAEDFIDSEIKEGGKYWGLFKTALALLPIGNNHLIMIPLVVKTPGSEEDKKIGILGVLKKGKFSTNELRDIKFFADATASVILAKMNTQSLKTMQSALLQKERMAAMGEMAAITSHAFKNILMGSAGLSEEQHLLAKRIRALADIINTKAALGKPTRRNLELLSEISAKMSDQIASNQAVLEDAQRTVRGMLSFAAVGSGEKQIIPLKSYMTDKLKYYQLQAKRKGITFRIDLSGIDDTEGLYIVESELGNLLLNLISNAIEAFDEFGLKSGGEKFINVSIKRDPTDHVLIVVEDNGCGIPSNKLHSLFVSSGRSTKPGGTGLGMITIKQIVDGNSGKISAKSHVGRGTTFTIRFPRKEMPSAKEHGKGTAPHEHVIPRTKAQKIKVMLVEDNKELRSQTKRILKEMGFSAVDDFPNAEEALVAIKKDGISPNLIISDQAMLSMNGHEFLSAVSVLYSKKKTPPPRLAIYSGDLKPSDKNPIAKTVADIGISWIEKGSDLKAFRSSVAKIVLKDGDDEARVMPGGYLQTQYSGNPYFIFMGRLVHKINNLITLPSALLALYSEGNKPQDLKSAIKEFAELNKVFDGLTDFAGSAKDQDFEKQSFKQCLLPAAIKKDGIVEDIWASLPPGQKYKLAILCLFYIKGIKDHVDSLTDIFKKESLAGEDLKTAAMALDSISKWKNAVMLVSETEEDTNRFSLYYELLEKD